MFCWLLRLLFGLPVCCSVCSWRRLAQGTAGCVGLFHFKLSFGSSYVILVCLYLRRELWTGQFSLGTLELSVFTRDLNGNCFLCGTCVFLFIFLLFLGLHSGPAQRITRDWCVFTCTSSCGVRFSSFTWSLSLFISDLNRGLPAFMWNLGHFCLGVSELFVFIWDSTQDLLIFYMRPALGCVCLTICFKVYIDLRVVT